MKPTSWLWLVGAVVLSLVGCKTATRPPGATDDYVGTTPTCIDHDGDGYGLHCALGPDCDDTNATVTVGCFACNHPSPGCPCATENARATCGKVAGQQGTQTSCSYGETVCAGGSWGECQADGKSVKTFDLARQPLGLAAAVPCNIACDPYCQQFPDTPDNSLTTPEGLLGTDGGLTLEQSDAHLRPSLPNGPMPGYIQATLDDGGIFADAQPDAVIYHELPPTATAQDTVAATTVVSATSIDVYVLENNAGTDLEMNAMLHSNMAAVATQIHATVPDAMFGVGRFGTYGQAPWNDTGQASVAFEHVLSPTLDAAQFDTALQYGVDMNVEASASPRTWVQALYAISTTGGLPSASASPWVKARADWLSPTTPSSGQGGPCPAGTVGYPCFRTTAIPVTVVTTDTPSVNGPGGQYALSRNAAWNVAGAKLWSTITPIAVPNNHNTEATAYPIDPNAFAIYTGNTNTQGVANSAWGAPSDPTKCQNMRASTARNVFFTFTAAQRTWYHFDPVGSAFATNFPVIYLYKKTGAVIDWIDCNENNTFGKPQQVPLALDGVVDPGTYYLVVDGYVGGEGPYVLHVNAMADGAAMGPVTEPNYNEAIAAYNAIGGKVVAVDGSGYNCDVAPHAGPPPGWTLRNTANSLEKLLRDTGSVDAGNNPYLLSLSNWGDPCHAADPPFGPTLAQAILDVTAPLRSTTARGDVTAVVVDADDATDFDGPPGGPNRLTPGNVDDTTFVTSITTISTADTMANCTQTLANQYVGCITGTPVTFMVNIQTPATITPLYHDQIFTFVVRILLNGSKVLSEIPIVVVVPALQPYLGDAWFVRDFDASTVCPSGTAPLWGVWAWNATTPGDSRIDFDISVAPTVSALPMAFIDPLQFSDPPGPTALAGQAIGAHLPDTQSGAANVDATLNANMRARDSKALRVRSHLIPSSDGTLAPTLQTWNLQVACPPAE